MQVARPGAAVGQPLAEPGRGREERRGRDAEGGVKGVEGLEAAQPDGGDGAQGEAGEDGGDRGPREAQVPAAELRGPARAGQPRAAQAQARAQRRRRGRDRGEHPGRVDPGEGARQRLRVSGRHSTL